VPKTDVVVLITQRPRQAAPLDLRRIRAEMLRHHDNDAGQKQVELPHGKEKVYGSIP
jgi:hypothetical protein